MFYTHMQAMQLNIMVLSCIYPALVNNSENNLTWQGNPKYSKTSYYIFDTKCHL